MFSQVVGCDRVPVEVVDAFMEFFECVCSKGTRDVKFVVVGAGEVGWFVEWGGFVALVANTAN